MDGRLVAWGRAVKSRRRLATSRPPPLWLFTDPRRTPLPAALYALPRGLGGVVFRHDGVPGRATLLQQVARLCRARGLALSVSGSGPLPLGAGRHLRAGRGHARTGAGAATASAHGMADLMRACRAGAACAFLSPVFPTPSHPGARGLGPVRWAAMARQARIPVLALGGLDGLTVRRLPRTAPGIGAIGALAPP